MASPGRLQGGLGLRIHQIALAQDRGRHEPKRRHGRAETPIGDVAELLERHAIKRVPIVKDGKVVGIVSRANLLQALASLKNMPAGKTDDAGIRAKLMAKLANERWTTPSLLNLIVHDGTVDLWGIVQSQTEKKAVRVLVESTAGVRAVNDNLIIPSTMSGLY